VNPLSAIYGAVVGARNRLYDRGLFRAQRLSGPVISVGSVSAGGAGKTPFVVLLGELLQERNIPFDVLSRGYGRRTRGVLQVSPDGSAVDFGDEPLLIARRLECPVLVGESRFEAGLFAEKKFGPQLHILDDGFQHRSLARDFDIVILTPEDMRDRLLPIGRLREPLSALRRADAIVLAGSFDTSGLPVSGKAFWSVRRDLVLENAPPNPIVFCGIARPQPFMEQLKARGVGSARQQIYRDHHAYSDRDIEELLRVREQSEAGGFVTTEKDAANLGPRIDRLQPLAIASVAMEMTGPADALDSMLRAIAERKRKT
jgi:tetraacyldisaccharide 4'-kinase